MKTKNENHNANVTNQNPLKQSHRSPNGKVARLPAIVRQIVNDMLYNGFPYKEIISTLEALGYPGFLHQNISNWKCGIHQHWLRQRQHLDRSRGRSLSPNGGEGQGEGASAPLPLRLDRGEGRGEVSTSHFDHLNAEQRTAILDAIDAIFGIGLPRRP